MPSFGRYEWMRILVPGFFFALLLELFLNAFPLISFSPDPVIHAALFLGVILTAGLTMYAKETPKRRRAFLENQPSQYLSAKARTMKDLALLDDAEARQLYFFILNNYTPPIFHEKIFFFGTIYHIMVQIRRTSFWFAVVGTLAVLARLSAGASLADQQSTVVFAVVIWILYLLNIRYNKADRRMQENYQDQILWLQMNNELVEQILRKRQSAPPTEP
ncbi:MAG TPA: hypothetical protein VGA55_09330 [Bacteroidota bacterium]